MPRLILAEGAVRSLERVRAFLAEKSPEAAQRAGQAIASKLLALETTPAMGRPFAMEPDWRELPIPFGDTGYIALYRLDVAADAIIVLAIRHQREAGYA
jgi:plasmid stabilization system protein ParE